LADFGRGDGFGSGVLDLGSRSCCCRLTKIMNTNVFTE
jgi:hypothetical protein